MAVKGDGEADPVPGEAVRAPGWLRGFGDQLRSPAGATRHALAWLAVAGIYVALRWNLVGIPLDRDEGLFGYIGQVIRAGGLPYRDVVDHKPPLVHFLYAMAAGFIRPEATPIHIFLHLYNFFTLLAVYDLARQLTDSPATGLWSALVYGVVSSLPSLQGCTASTEMFMLLPATLALAFALRAAKHPRSGWHALSGVMGGLTVLCKQSGLLLALFAAGTIGVRALREPGPWAHRGSVLIRRAFAWSTGFLAPIALVVAYFLHHQAFTALVRWVVTYNFEYAEQPQRMGIYDGFEFILKVVGDDALPVMLIALLTLLLLVLRRDRLGPFIAAFLACSLLATVPVAYTHYIAQMAPAIALAAGVGLAALCDWLPAGRGRRLAGLGLGALLAGYPVASELHYYLTGDPESLGRELYGDNPFVEAKPVADFIAARTSAADHVFVLGSEAEILFQARRQAASRFALKYPMTLPSSRHRNDYQHAAIVAISTRQPKYILVVNHAGSLLWDGRSHFPLHDYVKSLVEKRYKLEAMQPIANPQVDLVHGADAEGTLAATEFHRPQSILIYRRL
jgi:hypothetical protein